MNLERALLLMSMLAPAVAAQSVALSANAQQTAAIIGIKEIIDQFAEFRSQPPSTENTLRRLVLRQQITDAILETDLDVDATVSSIQREQTQLQVTRDYLSAQRDRLVGLTTAAATISGSGIGIVGSAMQFSDKTAYAGDGVSVGSGVASTILSLLSMRLQRGGKAPIEIAPNMLAHPFGRPSERVSAWPDDVWAYLNATPPSGVRHQTRLESLIEDWTRQGRISSQPSTATERKIEFLTSSFSERRRLSLNDLGDRFSMLADLSAQVALMKRDLAELAHYLRTVGW